MTVREMHPETAGDEIEWDHPTGAAGTCFKNVGSKSGPCFPEQQPRKRSCTWRPLEWSARILFYSVLTFMLNDSEGSGTLWFLRVPVANISFISKEVSSAMWKLLLAPFTGQGSHFPSLNSHVCCCCLVVQSCPIFCDPMDCSPLSMAPLSMGFSRQEYWSGLPCPSPGDLPDPGIEPESPALGGRLLVLSHPRSPLTGSAKDKMVWNLKTLVFKSRGWRGWWETSCVCPVCIQL